MNNRYKLFACRHPYHMEDTQEMFLNAVQDNLRFHQANCLEYAAVLKYYDFLPEKISNMDDLADIPVLPTLFFKSHDLYSVPDKKLKVKVTSSGTHGKQSHMGFDLESLYCALRMSLKTFGFHRLISPLPTHYIVLGYQPNRENTMSAVKTAYGATLFAPALHRVYALKHGADGYQLNLEGIQSALLRYAKSAFPTRLIGFPAYMFFLVETLQKENIKLKLPKGSWVFLAGGWKQFMTERIEKSELLARIEETLGIAPDHVKDFFGAVEHPVLYCDCKNHHFHVPVYSRVIIRDVKTLLPVEYGTPGLLNLITPLVVSVPLTSVMTDDLAVLHEGKSCSCGISSPWFEILGRVGMEGIKTCAAGAADQLGVSK